MKINENSNNSETDIINNSNKIYNNNLFSASTNNKLNKNINKLSIILMNFTSGLYIFSALSINYFLKEKINTSPSQSSIINSLLIIPLIIQPIFGLITDFYSLCGYKRKSYLIISGFLDCFCWIFLIFQKIEKIYLISLILFTSKICRSFNMVIETAINTEESKIISNNENDKNDKTKIQKFNELLIFNQIGMISGSILNGIAAQYFSFNITFIICISIIILNIIGGIIYNEKKSFKNINKYQKIENIEEINKNIKFNEIKNYKKLLKLLILKIYYIPLFIIFILNFSPSYFESAFFYFTDVSNMKPIHFGILNLLIMFMMLLSNILYKKYFINFSNIKILISVYIILSFFSSFLLNIYIYFHFKSIILIILFISFYVGFKMSSTMPIKTLLFCICPKGFEGSFQSLNNSVIFLGSAFSTLFGSILSYIFNINKENYDNFNLMVFICNIFLLFPLIFLYFIDNKYLYYNEKNNKSEEVIEINVISNKDEIENNSKQTENN